MTWRRSSDVRFKRGSDYGGIAWLAVGFAAALSVVVLLVAAMAKGSPSSTPVVVRVETNVPLPTSTPPALGLATDTAPAVSSDTATNTPLMSQPSPTQFAGGLLRAVRPIGDLRSCSIHVEWDPLEWGYDYDVQVCFGKGCSPARGVYRGGSWFFWNPALPLANRPDLTGESGEYVWRVVDTNSGRSSEPVTFTWTNEGCSQKQRGDDEGCDACPGDLECFSGRCQCPPGTTPTSGNRCER